MKKLSLALLTIMLMAGLAGCKKDESSLSCSVEYDFRMPAPLMEIADAYVYYTDNGQEKTEPMKNGRWAKRFSYKWEDDAVNSNDYDFNTLKIILKLKISPNELNAGAKLLDDVDAFMTTKIKWSFINDNKNYFSGSQTSVSNDGSAGDTYTFNNKAQRYEYTVEEQTELFDNQETAPFWHVQCSHVGTKCELTITADAGQSED